MSYVDKEDVFFGHSYRGFSIVSNVSSELKTLQLTISFYFDYLVRHVQAVGGKRG